MHVGLLLKFFEGCGRATTSFSQVTWYTRVYTSDEMKRCMEMQDAICTDLQIDAVLTVASIRTGDEEAENTRGRRQRL